MCVHVCARVCVHVCVYVCVRVCVFRSNADGLYYLNNFDNIVSSYVVLFELMVVNNWHVTMQGTVVGDPVH